MQCNCYSTVRDLTYNECSARQSDTIKLKPKKELNHIQAEIYRLNYYCYAIKPKHASMPLLFWETTCVSKEKAPQLSQS